MQCIIIFLIQNWKDQSIGTPSTHSFDFEHFQTFLQGIAGGNRNEATAKSIVADVTRFFESAAGSTSLDYTTSQLLSLQNLQNFYADLKREGKAATTIAEKLRRVRDAIKYSQSLLNEEASDNQIYIRAQKAVDTVSLWVRSMAKPIKLQRQKHTQKTAGRLAFIEDPYELIRGKKMLKTIKSAVANLRKGFNRCDAKLLTAYCAAQIIYQNSQRSGVIENVTIEEYNNRIQNEKEKVVITCAEHKTGTQGAAQLVIDRKSEMLLERYSKLVRDKIQANDDSKHLLFVTTTGKRYTQVYRKLKEVFKEYKIDLPTPSDYRIVVSTDASDFLKDEDYRAVARHLGHSTETSRRFYEIARPDSAVKVHGTIKKMAKERRWPARDITTLRRIWPMHKTHPPNIKISVQIQKELQNKRSIKDIINKWKYLKDKGK